MGPDIPNGNLGKVVSKTYIVMPVTVIDETGIIGQIKVTPSPAIGGIEQMAEWTVVKPGADGEKDFLYEYLVNVAVKFPDSCARRNKFSCKESDTVHRDGAR